MIVYVDWMESISPEVCDEMEKRDGRGRRLLNKDQWAALLCAYEASGMTQVSFCRHEGINYNSFVHQLSKHRKRLLAPAQPTPKFQQLEVSAPMPESFALEVSLPCGSQVRGNDARKLAQLIGLLRG